MGKMFEALQKVEREKIAELKEEAFVHPEREQMVLNDRLIAYFQPESVAAEQFKKLRSQLFKPTPRFQEPPRTILVTSATSGEGKTLVSINLAITLAVELQKYALLVDCDLRNPSLADWFGLSGVSGLSEYLTGNVAIQDLLVKTNVDKLTLFCGGTTLQENPVELIGSNKMVSLIQELSSRYPDRYIVIDAPPLLATTEPTVLTKMVDAIVFVIRAGTTARESVQEAMKVIDKDKIIGVVLNDMEFKTASLNSRYFGSRDGYYGYYAKKQKPQSDTWKNLIPIPRFFKKKTLE